MAAINAKDVAVPEDLTHHSATCWIKMSEATIEGLRQAFLDPESRIRLNPKEGEMELDEHAELVTLTWEGGFLDGMSMHLNPNLNVLIGGRGAGKSYGYRELAIRVWAWTPLAKWLVKLTRELCQQVLRSGTKISLCVRFTSTIQKEI